MQGLKPYQLDLFRLLLVLHGHVRGIVLAHAIAINLADAIAIDLLFSGSRNENREEK